MLVQRDQLLPQTVERFANDGSDRVFLEDIGGTSQTYAETDAAAKRWARAFRALGLEPTERVLVFMPAKMEAMNIWVGLGWLRVTEVPINTEYRGHMLKYIIEHSMAEVLVCAKRFVDAVLDIGQKLTRLKTIIVVPDGLEPNIPVSEKFTIIPMADFLEDGDKAAREPLPGPEPQDVSTLMYTSGTTGQSKGALLPWANFAACGLRMLPPEDGFLTGDDIFYSFFPVYHIGATYFLNGIAQLGGKVVMRERFSSSEFWKDIRKYSCTATFLLGATANFIFRQDPRRDDAENPLRAALIVPLPRDVKEVEQRFDAKFYTVYGCTEMGVPMRSTFDHTNTATCGRPTPDFEAKIVDRDDYEVPHGQPGELVLRPRDPWMVFNGYFEMPSESVTVLRNMWFHTGDQLRRDEEGNYYFVDRVSDSIRRRGENISSMEVEMYINKYEPVLESAAIAVPSEWGEDEVKICVVPKLNHGVDESSLIDFLINEQQMPKFMIPRYVEIIDELPKTPTGKVQKHKLKAVGITAASWDRTKN